MRTSMTWLAWLLWLAVVIAAPTDVGASGRDGGAGSDDPPGGYMGCASQGRCNGTVYKDRSNLDRWWYGVCSGCHTVQAPAPAGGAGALSPNQQKFVSNKAQFWSMHDRAKTDPVLVSIMKKDMLKNRNALDPRFRELLKR